MPSARPQPSDPPRRVVELPTGPASYTDEPAHNGADHVVVAVHGLPGSARDFRWLAPHLTPGARVVRPELPGFGDTPVATGPDASPEGRARYVFEVIEALELDRPLLLGHSMGGVAACAAVDMAPDAFGGLALVSSPGLRRHRMLERLPFGAMSRTLSIPLLGRALAPFLRALYRYGGFKGYPDRELYRTVHCLAATSFEEHAARIHRLELPTLVTWCDDDPLIDQSIARELADACPDGPRLPFAEGGHNPQKTHAVEIGQAVLEWLGALP